MASYDGAQSQRPQACRRSAPAPSSPQARPAWSGSAALWSRRPDRFRTARDVASESGVSAIAARRNLETLSARGLLEVRVGEETSYRYRPKSEELGRYCDLLAQHYITSRPAVLGFVATESRLSIKRFAVAFKLRDPE